MKVCKHCDYTTKWNANLSRHVKLHHTENVEKEFKCNLCDYSCHTNSNLERHLKIHTTEIDKWYACTLCEDYKTQNEDNLDIHVRITHEVGLTKHKCDICNKSFKTATRVKEHKMTHGIGIVWLECDLCDYKCKVKSALKSHKEAIHKVDQKEFPCNDCEYVTHSKAHLKLHKDRMHILENKEHACDLCDQKFKMKTDLRQHVRNVHEWENTEYMCDICGKSFKFANNVVRHKNDIHNINDLWFQCEQCTFQTKYSYNLREHYVNVHDVGDETCELCMKSCNKLHPYSDPNTTEDFNICKKCNEKIINPQTTVEHFVFKWLEKNFEFPIIKRNHRVNGNACLKYRPDGMYACPDSKVVIYVEVSEYQHSGNNYQCDEKRMSELYDETPGFLVVFLHFNPHGFTAPEGQKKPRKVEKRLELLLSAMKYILKDHEKIREEALLQCFYLYYSKTNPNIAKNIPKKFFYCLEDVPGANIDENDSSQSEEQEYEYQ